MKKLLSLLLLTSLSTSVFAMEGNSDTHNITEEKAIIKTSLIRRIGSKVEHFITWPTRNIKKSALALTTATVLVIAADAALNAGDVECPLDSFEFGDISNAIISWFAAFPEYFEYVKETAPEIWNSLTEILKELGKKIPTLKAYGDL